MSRAALIVSHGQPSEPEVGEAEIAKLAAAVSQNLPGWEVRGATLAQPSAVEAASGLAPEALVYPMFISDGWFTQVNLPRRLGGHRGRRLAPFGTDPDLPGLAADWVAGLCGGLGWCPAATDLVICAHGSGRSPMPALDTRIFAERLLRHLRPRRLLCGFVEQAPGLATALGQAGAQAVCLPFFATRRGHVLEDLPQAVADSGFAGVVLDPLGVHDEVPAMIARALEQQAGRAADER